MLRSKCLHVCLHIDWSPYCTFKGWRKSKTCCKATNPHSGEVFGDLNRSTHFLPLCQVWQKKKGKQNTMQQMTLRLSCSHECINCLSYPLNYRTFLKRSINEHWVLKRHTWRRTSIGTECPIRQGMIINTENNL